jgi:thiamine biosynthesis lipoprotein ApbE
MEAVHPRRDRRDRADIVTASEQLLAQLAATLRGPRRARRRLLEEIREDLSDAVQAELNASVDAVTAEAVVLARFGDASTVAIRWNSEHAKRIVALRRNLVLVLAAAATAGALGVTQHASGKSSPTRARGCTNTYQSLPCAPARGQPQRRP